MFGGHLSAQQSAVLSCTPRYGIVASFDPNTYRAKVVLAPSTDGETPLTGYLPVLAGYMGNGWGLAAPVQKGDQVIVLFMQNHPDQGVVLGRIYDQAHAPPMRDNGNPVAPGELVLRHQTGSQLLLANDGKVKIMAQAELDLTAPKVVITGDVTINGTVTVSGEGSFNGGHTVSKHTHGGVASGGAETGHADGVDMSDLADLFQYWNNDLQPGPTGDLAPAFRADRTSQRIIRRLLTNPGGGDYPWEPDYGAGLPAKIGDLLNIPYITALVIGQMALEASVARDPAPQVSIVPIQGGVSVSILYYDRSGQGTPLSFNLFAAPRAGAPPTPPLLESATPPSAHQLPLVQADRVIRAPDTSAPIASGF